MLRMSNLFAKRRVFDWRASRISRVDGETNGGAIFPIDHNVGKRGDARDFDADRREKPSRNGDCFDRLIHRAGADSLDFNANAIFYHAGNGARY